jgi:hypothetical protein
LTGFDVGPFLVQPPLHDAVYARAHLGRAHRFQTPGQLDDVGDGLRRDRDDRYLGWRADRRTRGFRGASCEPRREESACGDEV